MARSEATTVEEYLDELTDDRRATVEAVRDVVRANLPDGYEETVQFGMISYVVPLERYPKTYNRQALQYAALASQKNYVSLYLMNVYGNQETERWFLDSYKASGKRLDMGKSCVRFKTRRGPAARPRRRGRRPHLGGRLHRPVRDRPRPAVTQAPSRRRPGASPPLWRGS